MKHFRIYFEELSHVDIEAKTKEKAIDNFNNGVYDNINFDSITLIDTVEL